MENSTKGGSDMSSTAFGTPTKEFFVGMLTRDIELNDAILDLLDNCLDGVVRLKKDADKSRTSDYYKGFYSHITVREGLFVIEDNCGGIPREVAEKYAFRMGRSSLKEDEKLATVGIYGIGMKRAIFKIGKSAEVYTRNAGELYQVRILPDWANNENDWDFPIIDLSSEDLLLKEGGTKIEISNINPEISEIWGDKDKRDSFLDALIKSVSQSYSFIIQKGFEIEINGTRVQPLPIQLLVDDKAAEENNAVKPFLYQQTFDDVHVSLAIGMDSSPLSPDDLDDQVHMRRSSSDTGWTVVCNDRVVLHNDKSHLTGWGEAGVPQYHTQFIGIRGIVIFESKNPKNLPMTTTKRGIDTSSKIYAAVKNKMREGLKLFTDYTNRWKGRNEAERNFSSQAKSVSVDDLVKSKEEIESATPIVLKKKNDFYEYKPKLPKPENSSEYRTISFSRSIQEIQEVVEYFYQDRDHNVTPSQVGAKCFDRILEEARKDEVE